MELTCNQIRKSVYLIPWIYCENSSCIPDNLKNYSSLRADFLPCLRKIYTGKVCMILVEVLSFFVISCIRQIKVIYLISYKTSLEKVKNGEIKIKNEITCL